MLSMPEHLFGGHPERWCSEAENDGLEVDFPFQLGGFLGSMLLFWGGKLEVLPSVQPLWSIDGAMSLSQQSRKPMATVVTPPKNYDYFQYQC